MYDYIKGTLEESTPTEAVIENNGIGYSLQISLQTYTAIQGCKDVRLYIYHHLREDTELFFGFYSKEERSLFLLLIGVNGIGPNTARMMLSSLSAEEIRHAILSEDIARIKSVKGIGLKSAQRMVLELKDKIVKGEGSDSSELFGGSSRNEVVEEATRALIMLGFTKQAVTKAIQAVLKAKPDAKVEQIIKSALQMM